MLKKKLGMVFGLALLMMNILPLAHAEETEEAPTGQYVSVSGEIKEVYTDEDKVSLLLSEDGQDAYVLHISDYTYIADDKTTEAVAAQDLKAGDEITASFHSQTPVAMSYPAQLTPEVIVRHSAEACNTTVDVFNSENVSSDGMLKLHLSEKTQIEDVTGKAYTAEDTQYKTLLVYYTVSTRSIPAQTTPSKVIILPGIAQIRADIAEQGLAAESRMEKDGQSYVALRDVAEQFGYEIEWIADTQSVILSKGAVSYTLTIGETTYGYNKSLQTFGYAPFLQDGKTFVSSEFIIKLAEI